MKLYWRSKYLSLHHSADTRPTLQQCYKLLKIKEKKRETDPEMEMREKS